MKCKKMKLKDRRRIAPNEGVYARPHARAVRRRKNERRYVKDGSGRCQVFFVSRSVNQAILVAGHSAQSLRFYTAELLSAHIPMVYHK